MKERIEYFVNYDKWLQQSRNIRYEFLKTFKILWFPKLCQRTQRCTASFLCTRAPLTTSCHSFVIAAQNDFLEQPLKVNSEILSKVSVLKYLIVDNLIKSVVAVLLNILILYAEINRLALIQHFS